MNPAIELFFAPVEAATEAAALLPETESTGEEASFSALLDRELDDETLAALLASPLAAQSVRPPMEEAAPELPPMPPTEPRDPAQALGIQRRTEGGVEPTSGTLPARLPETMPIDRAAAPAERAAVPTAESRVTAETLDPVTATARPVVPEAEPLTAATNGPVTPKPVEQSRPAPAPEGNAAAQIAATRAGTEENLDRRVPLAGTAARTGPESMALAAASPEVRDAVRPIRSDRPVLEASEPGRTEAPRADVRPPVDEINIRSETAPVEANRPQPPAANAPVASAQVMAPAVVGSANGQPAVIAPEATTPPETSLQPAAPEEMPARIEWLAQRGGGVARVELDPPHLGRVEMIVRMRGSDVEVVIAASEPAAQAAVQAQRAQLVENLAARDLNLSQFDVTDSGGDAPRRDAGPNGRSADAGQGGRGQNGSEAGAKAVRDNAINAAAPSATQTNTNSRIDLHA